MEIIWTLKFLQDVHILAISWLYLQKYWTIMIEVFYLEMPYWHGILAEIIFVIAFTQQNSQLVRYDPVLFLICILQHMIHYL